VLPRTLNGLRVDFTQANMRKPNGEGDFDRALEKVGPDGKGVIVTFLDTYLDTNSTRLL
jgi:hypothetical protein